MKKKIIIGVLLAVFLMLMLPVNQAVESDVVENNQKTFTKEEIIVKKLVKRLNLLLLRIKDTHPEKYNEYYERLNNNDDEGICGVLADMMEISLFFVIITLGIGIAFVWPVLIGSYMVGTLLGCSWVDTESEMRLASTILSGIE